jgi:hypothetical protein
MAGIGTLPGLAAGLSRIARGARARYRYPPHDPSIGDGARARQGEARRGGHPPIAGMTSIA